MPVNNSSSKTWLHYIWVSILVLFIGIYLVSSQFGTPSHATFDSEPVFLLDTVWHNTLDDTEISSLPAKFPYTPDYTYTAYTTLSDFSDKKVDSLCFRASQSIVSVWIDGESVFDQEEHQQYKRSAFSGKAYGSQWIIIQLPEDYAGKELRIQSTSSHEKYAGVLKTIYVGTKSSLLYYMIHIYGISFVAAAIFFIISSILFLLGLFFFIKKIPVRQLLLYSLFGILSSFWMMGESNMIQFFTDRLVAVHNVTMLVLNLIPVPILFAFSDLPDFRYRKFCQVTVHIQLVYVIFLIILQAAGGPDLLEMLNISLALLFIHCFASPILLCLDCFYHKNKQLFSFALADLLLSVFSGFGLISSSLFSDTSISGFICSGVLAFYLTLCVSAVHQALNMYLTAKQSSFYQMLSHTDQMTNCRNRRDFMEHTASWEPGRNDVILMIDINYLKTINDTFGHDVGDTYIIECAKALQYVCSDRCECFRMGGDEFLIWGHDMTEDDLNRLEMICSELVIEKCRHISPLCSISIGSAIYRPEDASISDTIKRADLKMYEKKKKLKRIEIQI